MVPSTALTLVSRDLASSTSSGSVPADGPAGICLSNTSPFGAFPTSVWALPHTLHGTFPLGIRWLSTGILHADEGFADHIPMGIKAPLPCCLGAWMSQHTVLSAQPGPSRDLNFFLLKAECPPPPYHYVSRKIRPN